MIFQSKRVSRYWHIVLTAAAAAGVRFTLNSGQRTMREQWALYRQNMTGGHPKPGYPLTAVPTPWAPHIRVGRQDHAIDVDYLDGGETRLQRWLEEHGVHPTNPVRGETWHMELPAAELRALAIRFDRPLTRLDKYRARLREVRLAASRDRKAGKAAWPAGRTSYANRLKAAIKREKKRGQK